VDQNTAETYVVVGRSGPSPLVARIYEDTARINEGTSVSVEFLPEPVQFKDGDVAQRVTGPTRWVFVRDGGTWRNTDPGFPLPDQYSDERIVAAIRRGDVVRLVPEANGG
jgi:hypothetical protein